MENETSHFHSPQQSHIDSRRSRLRTGVRMSVCSRCCVFLLLICLCEFRMLEAADASRTLMSNSDHPHEVPSLEKGVNPQQHAVIPGGGSVHTEMRVGTQHE